MTASDTQPPAAPSGPIPEDIRPGFIPIDGGQLFRCLHCPTAAPRRDVLIVICPSAGHEYERSHRALRQLAGRLAAEGFHCLRLDYRGQGDSSGDTQSTNPQTWATDVETVLKQCLTEIKPDKIWLLGHRIGGPIALQVAQDLPADGLILWNSISTGAECLAEWDALECRRAEALGQDADLTASILGAQISPFYRDAIAGFTVSSMGDWKKPLLLLSRSDDGAAPAHAVCLHDEGGPIWRQEPLDAIVPFSSLSQIITWLKDVA